MSDLITKDERCLAADVVDLIIRGEYFEVDDKSVRDTVLSLIEPKIRVANKIVAVSNYDESKFYICSKSVRHTLISLGKTNETNMLFFAVLYLLAVFVINVGSIYLAICSLLLSFEAVTQTGIYLYISLFGFFIGLPIFIMGMIQRR